MQLKKGDRVELVERGNVIAQGVIANVESDDRTITFREGEKETDFGFVGNQRAPWKMLFEDPGGGRCYRNLAPDYEIRIIV